MVAKYRIETLDHDYLKERLRYDLLTGKFTWKKHPSRSGQWSGRYAEKEAGAVRTTVNGYRQSIISLDKRLYITSHLAWFYMLNRWPVGEIDHIDHDSLNDSWVNLREVSHTENSRNLSKRKNNTSSVTGVGWVEACKKWRARIKLGCKEIHGGLFDSFEEAVIKRKELENEYGFHKNHGT